MRKLIDEYLDGMLGTQERADLERRLAQEPALQSLLTNMQQERALRAAALATYQPTPKESAALAAKMLAETHAPLGYVGVWLKRIAAVAAILALIAGSFVMGRTTAPKELRGVATQQPDIRVIYLDDSGNKQMVEFNSLDEANSFLDRQHGLSQVAQNEVDLSRPGSI